jgi:hypothetical protein
MSAANASTALSVIEALKVDIASGVVPAAAKSLAELDADKYLAGVEDVATVTRFVNVWLGAKR